MIDISEKTRQEILVKYDHTCQKCGFKDITGEELVVHKIPTRFKDMIYDMSMLILLCKICHSYAPNNERYFNSYLNEKIDGAMLNTFRKAQKPIAKRTKDGMRDKLEHGQAITRPPKGYKLLDKRLVIDESWASIIKNIFEEYATSSISLTKLAKKINLTTPGLIKLLKNKTYIGIISFEGKEQPGQHEPILSKELFDKVQERLKD